jgi:hypothetical protein
MATLLNIVMNLSRQEISQLAEQLSASQEAVPWSYLVITFFFHNMESHKQLSTY